ncbi:cyanate transporter [Pantoea phytobeneficialis]|uniref:Cyanate transporter n=1 Tax=Pantoea phytobeneficialis TaxID=2052056 RepID=A0AAP9H2Z9_9GAMM|nr:cyanate transporter [Pantoea phytobeneficialis]MDO6407379.1 cyanate transporter [Pantoea phytobeneficialis]QGR05705.1 cyanate transporter [Pantoea phytobeneficialis]
MTRHSNGPTLAALVLAGLNMRPLLTSVSPLLGQLRQSIGLSPLAASLLPAVPMMMMGAVALLGAPLMQRLPLRRLLLAGLTLLLVALAVRGVIAEGRWLVLSALCGGLGIGIVQMVMPGLIRQRFSRRSTAVTGLWAGALMGGGGLGAALSPWLSTHLGWSLALSDWALPVLLAILIWLWLRVPGTHESNPLPLPSLWRKPRAWTLALSFGLVNGGYATCVAWLPDAYQQLGWSAQAGGALLAVMIALQVTGALLMPLLARGSDRRPQLIFSLACQLIGMAGFLLDPLLVPWLWAAIAGFGLGAAFPLAMVLALEHLPQPQAGARLVAFMQGWGFIIAGCMPFIAGQLHTVTDSFTSVWLMQGAVVVGLIALNFRFHPRSYRQAFGQPGL